MDVDDQKHESKPPAQHREIVFSPFPGAYGSAIVDEDTDSRAEDRILIWLAVLAVICLAAVAVIAL